LAPKGVMSFLACLFNLGMMDARTRWKWFAWRPNAEIFSRKFVQWTSSIRNSRPYDVQECPLERDFCTFPLENLDLYYVLDVSLIRIEWFWRPWRRRGTI